MKEQYHLTIHFAPQTLCISIPITYGVCLALNSAFAKHSGKIELSTTMQHNVSVTVDKGDEP